MVLVINMENKKINWGTLVIGVIIGAVLMWIIGAYTKPAVTEGGKVVRLDLVCAQVYAVRPTDRVIEVGSDFAQQGNTLVIDTFTDSNVVLSGLPISREVCEKLDSI